jgi:hypothetical protein
MTDEELAVWAAYFARFDCSRRPFRMSLCADATERVPRHDRQRTDGAPPARGTLFQEGLFVGLRDRHPHDSCVQCIDWRENDV